MTVKGKHVMIVDINIVAIGDLWLYNARRNRSHDAAILVSSVVQGTFKLSVIYQLLSDGWHAALWHAAFYPDAQRAVAPHGLRSTGSHRANKTRIPASP